ncbi:MAG: DUF2142 domain-containing protein [Lachnospiraceae bacterium]|nr:DUF2142 domain-containing protein [Lachnospiraceae bacterium]
MQNKSRLQHFLRYMIVLLVAVTLAFLVECVIFQFPALRYKQEPIAFALDGVDEMVEIVAEDELAQLTEDEIRSIEVERDNQKLLAEYNGEEYVEPVDETLVEKNGTMYRKVKKTTIKVDLVNPYYIHKMDFRVPVTESAGYSAVVYRDGKVINDNIYCTIEAKIGAGVANVSEYADYMEISLLSQEELAPEDMKLTISNAFKPNAMRIGFIILFLLMAAILVLEKDALREKQEWIFAVICLMLGSLLICGIGTNQVSYDEYVHAKTAYKLSFGTTIEFTESALQMSGNLLPYFNNPEERALVEAYENRNNDFSWADIGSQSRFVRSETRVYYPMAAGFWLGRTLRLGFAETVALAKLGNLLFYILIVFFAIRMAGKNKNIVALIGLLPNSVFLAASLTYDAVVNSFLLLGMVLIINEILEPERKLTWQNLLMILLSFAVGCQSKPIYIVMALLILFYGKDKFPNRWQGWICKAAILIVAGLMIYNIFFPTPSAGSDYYLVNNFDYAGDKRNLGTSVTGQIQYVLSNPVTYALLLLRSMAEMTGGYLFGGTNFFQYGYLGTAPKIATYLVIVLALWLMLAAAKGEKRRGIGLKYILLMLIMILGTSAIVWTSMYASYTTVGADEIRGVQGRYFIPMFLPFAVCFLNSRWESRLQQHNRSRIMFGIMAAINMFMIYGLVIIKMNV